MSSDPAVSLGAATAPGGTAQAGQATSSVAADRQQIRRLAQEFEALLMVQMLRSMRQSMLEDDSQSGLGASPLTDTADLELAGALSRVGGIGLSDILVSAFERQLGASGTAAAPDPGSAGAPDVPAAVAGLVGLAGPASHRDSVLQAQGRPSGWPVQLRGIAVSGRVTSGYGWRPDPLTGVQRFHAGVDIAAAYGRTIRAAADGTVVFSGEQSGYGQTVVIDHGRGQQTRYAHLSQPLVKVGDAVRSGAAVGQVGDSGRSTGPHVHFEVLVNGHPIDPGE
jgi:murein DD-endopeptidase MepM/ murein hydrolase activator NlpD